MGDSLLLTNLVIALIAALVGAIAAARLKQSIILGYILAGVAIGPFTPGVEGNYAVVEQLAQIGIVLLLFAIGVQFSLGDLLHAGRVAVAGSVIQVIVTIAAGFGIGLAFGWDPLEALFFGAVLSNSSSTVLSKVLGERGEMGTGHGKLALAWSTVQDLSTIILIVVLSALATDSDQLLLDLAIEVGKASLFLALLLPLGLRVLPWIFEHVASLRSREIFVLTVGVVALGLAYSATFFGLSLALGAFVVGVVVSESDLSHQILGEVLPLRDIFAGLFFVSVGMLVDPGFVLRNIPLVLLTLAVIVLFKGALSAGLAWLLGTPTRTALLTGVALAQSAEFSFLLAQVGRDVDAISATSYSLMLAAAAASIVLLPSLHTAALPAADALHTWRPAFREGRIEEVTGVDTEDLRNHAVICGFGRVGTVIGRVLRNRFNYVVIEEDARMVAALRRRGVPVIRGNAAVTAILEQAQIDRARELIIALPDPVVTRQVVDRARELNPRIRIIARTHSEPERQWLIRRNVDSVVLGEWELALEMALHALRGFGVGSVEADAVIQRLRGQEDLESIRADLARPTPPRVVEPEPEPEVQAPAPRPAPEAPIQRRLHDGVRFRSERDIEEERETTRIAPRPAAPEAEPPTQNGTSKEPGQAEPATAEETSAASEER